MVGGCLRTCCPKKYVGLRGRREKNVEKDVCRKAVVIKFSECFA
jgi:hypothetical protein